MLANNLANSTTGGFKADREFYTLFSASDETQYDGQGSSTALPQVKSQWTDFSQGTLQPTGSPLDLALSGGGFFTVAGPSGPLYTRNGAFQLSSSGELTTAEGYPVKDVDGKNIQSQSQGPITVGADGTVAQDGQTLAQISVVDFQDRTVLSKLGASYFVNTSKTAKPAPAAADTSIAQGRIENSNVSPAESAVRLVGIDASVRNVAESHLADRGYG